MLKVKKIVTTLNEAEVPSEDIVEVVESPPFVFLAFVKSFLRSDFHVVEYILQMSPMSSSLSVVEYIFTQSIIVLAVLLSTQCVGDKVAYALSQGLKSEYQAGRTLFWLMNQFGQLELGRLQACSDSGIKVYAQSNLTIEKVTPEFIDIIKSARVVKKNVRLETKLDLICNIYILL
ncbi:hypothetical protein Prudu_016021 [Prunus dulcis]|uniref:Uncharacterized protein n=1 Tax=Prunus dulcis TaxID=3755 RepID=A0A4Y1RKD1_PRUDU|nr:hypothetical protein Prudu_016021 [Prunus dulcis]